jgi:hypothetical protein
MRSGIVKSNSNQIVYTQDVQKDIYIEDSVVLNGSGTQYYPVVTTAREFLIYQIADPLATLSGALTVNLEMSNDGVNWLQATDANGDAITHSLSAGSSIMEKLSDVNHFVKLRFSFASAVTGTLDISIRV